MQEAYIDILQEMDAAQIFSLTGDSKVQEIIGRLKFMAKIRHGEKINVRERFVRDNDSVLQRILRTCRNVSTYISSSEIVESKEATLGFIRTTVNDAITLIAVYRRDRDDFKQSIANIIVENLESSKGGIRNLIATYQWDRKFISEAEAVIQTLEARISSMKKKGYMKGFTDESFMPKAIDFNESRHNDVDTCVTPIEETVASSNTSTPITTEPEENFFFNSFSSEEE